MKHKGYWKIIAGIAMVVMSIAVYLIHYLIFMDAHHIFIYLVGDIAFVFIEVLMVSLIIHHVLNEWEKKSHLKKLNMVIEVFFSDFGKHLLVYLSNFDNNLHTIHDLLIDKDGRGDINFKAACKALQHYKATLLSIKLIYQNWLNSSKIKEECSLTCFKIPTSWSMKHLPI
ncbi:MAG: hypothetical protein KKH94_03975 [Candidatus Omnitrophica bacterium]|nr:hypothetical protein [Candidatus Omnitrophota bacterium]